MVIKYAKRGPVSPLRTVVGGLTGVTAGLTANAVLNRLYPSFKKRPAWQHGGMIGAAGLLGTILAAGKDALHGTGYAYDSYKVPRKSSEQAPVTIVFSGANGGDWQDFNPDEFAMDRLIGRGKYKMFGYNDMDVAQAYIRALPENAHIRIIGHSLGGPAAYELASYASAMGRSVDQLDTLDPVGIHLGFSMGDKPSGVKVWNNYYPKERKLDNKHDSNYIAVLGGAFDNVPGADNNIEGEGEYANHKTIRFLLPDSTNTVQAVPEELKRFARMGVTDMMKAAAENRDSKKETPEEEQENEYTRLPASSYAEFVRQNKKKQSDYETTSSVNALATLATTAGVGTMVAGDKQLGGDIAAGALGGALGYHGARLAGLPPVYRLALAILSAGGGAYAMHRASPFGK